MATVSAISIFTGVDGNAALAVFYRTSVADGYNTCCELISTSINRASHPKVLDGSVFEVSKWRSILCCCSVVKGQCVTATVERAIKRFCTAIRTNYRGHGDVGSQLKILPL